MLLVAVAHEARHLKQFLQQTAFENNVGKGEIAPNEYFILFPQITNLQQTTYTKFRLKYGNSINEKTINQLS